MPLCALATAERAGMTVKKLEHDLGRQHFLPLALCLNGGWWMPDGWMDGSSSQQDGAWGRRQTAGVHSLTGTLAGGGCHFHGWRAHLGREGGSASLSRHALPGHSLSLSISHTGKLSHHLVSTFCSSLSWEATFRGRPSNRAWKTGNSRGKRREN